MNRKTILQQQKSLDTGLTESTSRKGLRWRRGSLSNGKQSKNKENTAGTLTQGREVCCRILFDLYMCIIYNNILKNGNLFIYYLFITNIYFEYNFFE